MTKRESGAEHAAGRIEDDHRELRSRLEVLTSSADLAGVLSRLLELPKLLAEHFAEEEASDGLYEDLARRSPALGEKLDALRHEHREILEDLETLSRDIQHSPGPQAQLGEDARRSISRCAERLRRHEQTEAAMIADVYYTDEGGRG